MFNFKNTIVAVGVGGADEGLIYLDERNGRTAPFKTWTDWGRLGLVALSALGIALRQFENIAQPVFQSSVPLATKTVIQAVRTGAPATTRKVEVPAPRARVARIIGRSYEEEFKQVGAF